MPPSSSLIDLFQGWPSPALLPTSLIKSASQSLLADPELSVPSLLYGPDSGPPSLLDALAPLLAKFYSSPWTSRSRLTTTGGASQGLSCILQAFSDPLYTQNVYMVAPTYFLACRIFEDHGFVGRLKAVPEDEEGIDIDRLDELITQDNRVKGRPGLQVSRQGPRYIWASNLIKRRNSILRSRSPTKRRSKISFIAFQHFQTPQARPCPLHGGSN